MHNLIRITIASRILFVWMLGAWLLSIPVSANPIPSPGNVLLNPAYSPDGKQILFIESPDPRTLNNPLNPADAQAQLNKGTSIWIADADGANAKQLTAGRQDAWPQMNPTGTLIVFARIPQGESDSEIFTISPLGAGLKRITNNDAIDIQPVFTPPGHQIVFVSKPNPNVAGKLVAIGLDGSNARTLVPEEFNPMAPQPMAVSQRIYFSSNSVTKDGRRDPNNPRRILASVLPTGTDLKPMLMLGGEVDLMMAKFSAAGDTGVAVAVKGQSGAMVRLHFKPQPQIIHIQNAKIIQGAAISADGQTILFAGSPTAEQPDFGLWAVQGDNKPRKLTITPANADIPVAASADIDVTRSATYPIFSPDGKSILYGNTVIKNNGGVIGREIWLTDLSGKNNQPILQDKYDQHARFSPDGGKIIFTRRPEGEKDAEIFLLDLEKVLGSRRIARVTTNDLDDDYPAFAPDGRSILWKRTDPVSNTNQILIAREDGSDQRVLVGPELDPGQPLPVSRVGMIAFTCRFLTSEGSISKAQGTRVAAGVMPQGGPPVFIGDPAELKARNAIEALRLTPAADLALILKTSGQSKHLVIAQLSNQRLTQVELPIDPRTIAGFDISPDGQTIVTACKPNLPDATPGLWLFKPDGAIIRRIVPDK